MAEMNSDAGSVSTKSRDLISELRHGEVVLFAGAGISLGTHGQQGLPSASELTRMLALEADFCRLGQCWNFNQSLACCNWTTGCVGSYSEAAEHYAEQLGRSALLSFLRRHIEIPGVRPLRTHQAIARLPLAVIVTTNWDCLLDEALSAAGKQVVRVVDNYEVAFANCGDVLLVKMHGSIERPDSIILTERDYQEFFERLPSLVDMLLYFFATRTFMFVGYSLADPNFKQMYLQVTRHLRDRYGKLYRRVAYADQWRPSEYQRRFWHHHNLRLIDEDATIFLETLADHVAR
jgi:hypothetical protein